MRAVLLGDWPWQWSVYSTPAPPKPAPPPKPPKPVEKTWRLVDLLAEQLGLSRGKARDEVLHGRVLVDGKVEQNADRQVTAASGVEWVST